MRKEPGIDFMHQKREDLIAKARSNLSGTLGLKRQNSSSRRDIMMPDRDLKTPVVVSAANPISKHARGASGFRQKTTLNTDLSNDLLAGGAKPKVGKAPLPAKRGNSLNPARMKTSSAAELVNMKSSFMNMVGKNDGETGTAANSTAFSKRSS